MLFKIKNKYSAGKFGKNKEKLEEWETRKYRYGGWWKPSTTVVHGKLERKAKSYGLGGQTTAKESSTFYKDTL